MDFFELTATVQALRTLLTGGRFRSCGQKSNRTILFSVKTGLPAGEDWTLTIALSHRNPGVYLTREPVNKTMETLLARSFRKKTAGAVISAVEMPWPDRIVCFSLNLAEWPAPRNLWIELVGGLGNATLVDTGTGIILECLTKHPEDRKNSPLRMPGRRFEPIWQRIRHTVKPLKELTEPGAAWPEKSDRSTFSSALLNTRVPMTPRLAADLAAIYFKSGVEAASSHVLQILDSIPEQPPSPEAAESLLMKISAQRENAISATEFRERKQRIRGYMTRALKKSRKNIRAVQSDLAKLPDPRRIREIADSLAASFHLIRPGMDAVEVPNIHHSDASNIRIPLDPNRSPQNNLNRLFKRAGKADRARPRIMERIEALQREESAIEAMVEAIDQCESMENLAAIEQELVSAGFMPSGERRRNPEAMLTRKPYHRFRSRDGWDIWVGRSAAENDMLTFRDAAPMDFWLHAHGTRGAHVVIRNPEKKQEAPPQTLSLAVRLAVFYSRSRGEKAVSVFLTQKKHVRKAPGNIPGRAIVTKHTALTADYPDDDAPPVEPLEI